MIQAIEDLDKQIKVYTKCKEGTEVFSNEWDYYNGVIFGLKMAKIRLAISMPVFIPNNDPTVGLEVR